MAAVIEALLFSLGALSVADLAGYTGASLEDVNIAIEYLANNRAGQGIVLVSSGDMLELRAAPEAAEIIEQARMETYNRDIGRAGMEVLAAILYQGAQSRAQIDFIRGVNSAQILRNLTMRGLIRKIPNPKDPRQFVYEPTTELLTYLGITNISAMPEFENMRSQLQAIVAEAQENNPA